MAPKFPWQVLKLITESAMTNGISFSQVPTNIALFDRLVRKRTISQDDLERLMANLEQATGRSDLALLCGKTFIAESIDDYLTLGFTAKNLEHAINLFSRYKILLHPSIDLRIEIDEHYAWILYQSNDGYPIGNKPFYSEGLFSCIYHRVKDVTGLDFKPVKVQFRHPAPPHAEKYPEYFPCPVTNGGEVDFIQFDRDILYAPFHTHDPEMNLELQRKAESRCAKTNSVLAQINEALANHLADESFTLEDLAMKMNMSRRSLQRKLKDHGLTFSTLRNNLRIMRAKETIAREPITVDLLAEQLGFMNAHSFRQFFKKHTGQTVSQYRQQPLMQSEMH